MHRDVTDGIGLRPLLASAIVLRGTHRQLFDLPLGHARARALGDQLDDLVERRLRAEEHDVNGATCIDDGDHQDSQCGDTQDGATEDGSNDGSGADAETKTADAPDAGDAVAEHNFPADGCADGSDNGGDDGSETDTALKVPSALPEGKFTLTVPATDTLLV